MAPGSDVPESVLAEKGTRVNSASKPHSQEHGKPLSRRELKRAVLLPSGSFCPFATAAKTTSTPSRF